MTASTTRRAVVDGRRSAARRFRDLVADFARDLGGEGALSAAELALIRQAAAITLQCETLQIMLLNGDAVASDDLVRLTNASTRILTALGATRHKRQPAHVPLRDRIGAE
jgi:hypothetical protein